MIAAIQGCRTPEKRAKYRHCKEPDARFSAHQALYVRLFFSAAMALPDAAQTIVDEIYRILQR